MNRCEELKNTINDRKIPFISCKNNELLVSIIVLNRNGISHLKRLIPALIKHTNDVRYELIFVDNASCDNSVNYIKNFASEIPLRIVQNKTNESFSVANNKAVELAKGKYIVLLNNDVEPLAGWLNYLLESAESTKGIGSVGARLIYPGHKSSRLKNPFKKQFDYRCTVQHAGIAFKSEDHQLRPYNLGKGKSINDPEVLKSGIKSALTAACLLVPKTIYMQVGGLDESYNYGGEDVDFGLRLLNAGYINFYCADSLLFHHEFGTQGKEKRTVGAKRRQKNLQLFQDKWFLHIKKAYWAEKIYGESSLYAELPLTIAVLEDLDFTFGKLLSVTESFGWKLIHITKKESKSSKFGKYFDFMLTENTKGVLVLKNAQISVPVDDDDWPNNFRNALISYYLNPSIAIKIPVKIWKRANNWGDYHLAVLLKQQLENEGHYVLLQILPEWNNDKGLACDVAIVFRGLSRYVVKPSQINIMWNISHPDKVTLDEYEEYDQVFIASDSWAEKIKKQVSTPVERMLQCTDPQRFHEPDNKERSENKHQLLFVGNYRQVYRKVLKDLLPTDYDLAVYGKSWKKIIPQKYIKSEHIHNDGLYKYYGSAEILLNDHWDEMRKKGFVSNRIYDGLACGAFILTDKVKDMGELNKFVQTYETREELDKYIEYYLEHPEERKQKALTGQEYVLNNHTFAHRAKQFSESIQILMDERLRVVIRWDAK